MPQIELTLGDAREALRFIPDDRPTWVNMAFALKTEFGEDGKETWVEWSKNGDGYNEADANAVWKSASPGKVTIGSLIYLAKKGGWEPKDRDWTPEEKKAFRAEQEARRKENERKAQESAEAQQQWHEHVAAACEEIRVHHLTDSGKSDYLQAKKVKAYGLLFARHSFIVVTGIQEESIGIISGKDEISDFFDKNSAGKIDRETTSFNYVKYGSIAVPMRDIEGKLWGFQFISPTGGKTFFKFGRKKGLYHLIAPQELLQATAPSKEGPPLGGHLLASSPARLAFGEGYSTCASILMATQWPVVITFDSGNIRSVAPAFRGVYPESETLFVFCGDDDRENKKNDGRLSAQKAANMTRGIAVFPDFTGYEQAQEEAA